MLIRPVTKEERLQSAQLLTIESGDLTISAADDAIHCDYTLQIGAEGTDWPAISITDCDEGLEAAALHVASGDIRIRASDDCLNAANSDLSGFDFSMDISGGTISAYTTDGAGFDSNGSMTMEVATSPATMATHRASSGRWARSTMQNMAAATQINTTFTASIHSPSRPSSIQLKNALYAPKEIADQVHHHEQHDNQPGQGGEHGDIIPPRPGQQLAKHRNQYADGRDFKHQINAHRPFLPYNMQTASARPASAPKDPYSLPCSSLARRAAFSSSSSSFSTFSNKRR